MFGFGSRIYFGKKDIQTGKKRLHSSIIAFEMECLNSF